jgi:thiamine-phosphate pyrophosphorylase
LPADKRTAARLYLITAARTDLTEFLEAAVQGGVDIVQIREKELPDAELIPVLHEARQVTRRLGVPLVVNDRPDLAALIGADFAHVGQDDTSVDVARRFGVGVGLSTHAPEEVDAADADYIGVGPVFATPM